MRLSELLGSEVIAGGEPVGVVTDVRLAQVGALRGVLAELVVESLLVSPRHAGSQFGYERGVTRGPWLIRRVVRWLHRGAFMVDWDAVSGYDLDAKQILLVDGHRRRPAEPV
jgi:hypothetical protein